MESLGLNIKFNIENLEEIGSSKTDQCVEEHSAQLTFKISHLPVVELKILFESKSRLSEKIGWWAQRNGYDKLIASMTVVKVEQSNGLKEIDFGNSKVVGISQSFSFFENGSRHFLIKLDSIRLVYPNTKYKGETRESDFYLNCQLPCFFGHLKIEFLSKLSS